QSTWTAHSRVEALASGQLQMRIPDPAEIRMVNP
ncbi:cell division protein FtsL, partial [Pseudomonas oryzihabitans]